MRGGTMVQPGDGTLLEALLPRAVELISEFHEADLGGVAEWSDGGTAVKVSVAPTDIPGGEVSVHRSPPSTAESMNAYALAEGSAIIVTDLPSEARFSDALLAERGVTSAMIVPIVVRDEPVGTLGIYWTRAHRFVPEDVHAAEAIARLLSTKVSRAESWAQDIASLRGQGAPRDIPPEGEGAAGADEVLGDLGDLEKANGSGKNRRSSKRLPFQHWQRIAPIYGGVLPTLQQFFKVECCDLSNGGVSLYVASRPLFNSLVVALGAPPDERFFTARVVRVTPQARDGREVYQLGCQFMGRVHL